VRNDGRAPILVTGAPRTSTTFVGQILSIPRDVSLIYEPLNHQIGMRAVPRQFLYVNKGSFYEGVAAAMTEELLAGRAKFKRPEVIGTTPSRSTALLRKVLTSRTAMDYRLASLNPLRSQWLIKDPMAAFATEWLHQRYGAKVVVTLRHPAGAVASYLRLGWRFHLSVLSHQNELMQDHLAELLGGHNPDTLTPVQEGALLWSAVYRVLGTYMDRNPEIVAVRHEDVSSDPIGQFESLYDHLGLTFSSGVRRQIEAVTGAQNPTDPKANQVHTLRRNSQAAVGLWRKHLDAEQLHTIRELTEPYAQRWYSDADW
jgi:hypothetical protein